MKIRIATGDVEVERDVWTAQQIPATARGPLAQRTARVRAAIAANRRRRMRAVPEKPR